MTMERGRERERRDPSAGAGSPAAWGPARGLLRFAGGGGTLDMAAPFRVRIETPPGSGSHPSSTPFSSFYIINTRERLLRFKVRCKNTGKVTVAPAGGALRPRSKVRVVVRPVSEMAGEEMFEVAGELVGQRDQDVGLEDEVGPVSGKVRFKMLVTDVLPRLRDDVANRSGSGDDRTGDDAIVGGGGKGRGDVGDGTVASAVDKEVRTLQLEPLKQTRRSRGRSSPRSMRRRPSSAGEDGPSASSSIPRREASKTPATLAWALHLKRVVFCCVLFVLSVYVTASVLQDREDSAAGEGVGDTVLSAISDRNNPLLPIFVCGMVTEFLRSTFLSSAQAA